jgi:hypothetical protein
MKGTDMSLVHFRDHTGQLAAYAWQGGYPIYYVTSEGATLCPACANKDDGDDPPVGGDVHWEGEPLTCDDCQGEIESAYGAVQ